MSDNSLLQRLEAHGSFPEEAAVRANFELLFGLARDGGESVQDLAGGFELALDQWSHVDAATDPAIAARLRDWTTANWTDTPHPLLESLCRLLVNVRSPEVTEFLRTRADAAADPDVRETLQAFLAQLQPARPPAQD